jgi:hypothetical protein
MLMRMNAAPRSVAKKWGEEISTKTDKDASEASVSEATAMP